MDYCKYHPLEAATYVCEGCQTHTCDRCCHDRLFDNPLCLVCGKSMVSLGAVNYATPFWRRLEESFRYPLAVNALVMIVAFSLLSTVLFSLPFGFLWSLLLTGAFMKYCFACLENTSQGHMQPPDITSAYGGGLKLVAQLLGILLGISVAVLAAFKVFGPGAAGFVAIISTLGLPAILILFGLTDKLSSALNPLKIFGLITAIGLPYALLLAFILIMMASVGVLNEVVGQLPVLARILESMVSSYYTIAMFHIMGYMIFQYQDRLGYIAREQAEGGKKVRPEREQISVKIDVNLKEGNYDAVLNLLNEAVKLFPNDSHFRKQLMEFLIATKNMNGIDQFGSSYLEYLANSNQEYWLCNIYDRIIHFKPDFIPDSAMARHQLAQVSLDKGDFPSAIKLINGMHRKYPDYAGLIQAFQIMLKALEHSPNKELQANQCREFIQRLEKLSPQPKKTEPPQNKEPFVSARETRNQIEIDSVKQVNSTEQDDKKKDLPPIEFTWN